MLINLLSILPLLCLLPPLLCALDARSAAAAESCVPGYYPAGMRDRLPAEMDAMAGPASSADCYRGAGEGESDNRRH